MDADLLAIYLRDHHAAGTAGARLAARAANKVAADVDGRDELPRIAGEIAADLRTLEKVMVGEGIAPSAVKDTLAICVEKLGRLKLNGRVRSRSRLSDVIELETLLVGIGGKKALWDTLARTRPSAEDFELLVARATSQRDAVSRCRDAAALKAFGTNGVAAPSTPES